MTLLLVINTCADTTRPARPGEINGQDYFFVTREEFECDIEQDRFLEYGELKGFYYGTTFSSIKKIIESHRVPVLELHPQVNNVHLLVKLMYEIEQVILCHCPYFVLYENKFFCFFFMMYSCRH